MQRKGFKIVNFSAKGPRTVKISDMIIADLKYMEISSLAVLNIKSN